MLGNGWTYLILGHAKHSVDQYTPRVHLSCGDILETILSTTMRPNHARMLMLKLDQEIV